MKLSEIHELNLLCDKLILSATEVKRKYELLAKYDDEIESEQYEDWKNNQPV